MGASNVIDEIAADLAKNAQMLRTDTADSLLKRLTDGTLTDEQLSELQGLFSNNLADDIAEPDFQMDWGGVGTLPLADLVGVKGKAKSCKSTFCLILMAALLGYTRFGLTATNANGKVIYFDTEQTNANTARLIRRAHKMLGWNERQNSPRLLNYSMRQFTTEQRVQFIEQVTRKEKPTAIVIDGIADLIHDFNNVEQSQSIVLELMKMATETNCCCICVLHSAKTSETGEMKGHLGSLLLQKVSDCFEVKRDSNGVFTVEQTECRNRPVDKFSFILDDEGLPQLADDYLLQKAQEKAEKDMRELREYVGKAFATDKELTYSNLIDYLMATMNPNKEVSERTAERKIKALTEKGIIEKGENGKYYLLPI